MRRRRGRSRSCWRSAEGLLLTLAVGLAPAMVGAEPGTLEVGAFSRETGEGVLPSGWKPLTFPKIAAHSQYRLERDGERMVVRAESRASASGIVRAIAIDPREYPIVEWRWKVANVLEKGDVTRKSGDDYPARLYITFEYDPARLSFFERAQFETVRLLYGEYPPIAAVNYLWESKAPVGTVVANPYTSRVQMIVVESGKERVGEWREARRNLLADYRKAFGDEPPRIAGVALMTDTDNTGESATAWYGDVVFRRAE